MGLPWDKEERKLSQQAKKEFFPPGEEFSEEKNGVRRSQSIMPPSEWSKFENTWDYITCEGRFSIVYGYHFRLLTELRHQSDLPVENRSSASLISCYSLSLNVLRKLKEGIPDQVAHHGLIKLLVEYALHSYKVPLAWEAFRNLTKDGDIKMLAEEGGSSSTEEKESVATKEKETGKKTTSTVQKKGKEKKQATKDVGEEMETPVLTARENRLQGRIEQSERVHVSTSTPTVPATKPKAKIQTEKKAKVVTPVATGKTETGFYRKPENNKGTGFYRKLENSKRRVFYRKPDSDKNRGFYRKSNKGKNKEGKGWYFGEGGRSCAGCPQHANQATRKEEEGDPSIFQSKEERQNKNRETTASS